MLFCSIFEESSLLFRWATSRISYDSRIISNHNQTVYLDDSSGDQGREGQGVAEGKEETRAVSGCNNSHNYSSNAFQVSCGY